MYSRYGDYNRYGNFVKKILAIVFNVTLIIYSNYANYQ